MIQNLSIQNYALISSLEVQPSAFLNIITGETGAGKSILLGAVGLLLGNRADSRTLLDEQQKCVIEGVFEIQDYNLMPFFEENDLDYESTTIIRREITPSGKSRAFVNDTPVTLDVLKNLGKFLVDIHSQHDNLLLGDSLFQLNLVDLFAKHKTLIDSYRLAFSKYRNASKEFERLKERSAKINQEEDYLKFQLEELENAKLVEGEQHKLESELSIQENAENIKSKLYEALVSMDQSDYSIQSQLGSVQGLLSQVSRISDKYSKLSERVAQTYIEIKDIIDDLQSEVDSIEYSPEKIEELQDRVNLINKLEKKHQVESIEDLLQIQKKLEDQFNEIESISDNLLQAEKTRDQYYEQVLKVGKELSDSRKNSFQALENEAMTLLQQLGMEKAILKIESVETNPGPNGLDEIQFLFSANKGIAPLPLKKVASGGEFSRLLFCLKSILAKRTSLPTLIFDEIDTGISGEVAIKMARLMKDMARHHQVMAISHLPQFAAIGDTHYFVFKDTTSEKSISKIRKLEGEDRIMEIAKMIGGEKPSDIAFENAKELIEAHA